MKIIVTSDLHKNMNCLNYILYNYDANYYLDCGDSEMSNYQLKNFETVLGNCDYENYPRYLIKSIDENLKIFITHGHLYTIDQMVAIAKNNDCKIILYGHTHIKKIEELDGLYIINPGSITKPRNMESNTFLEIDYNEETLKLSFNFIKITL